MAAPSPGSSPAKRATSIALKGADGIEQNVVRSEVKSLKSTGMSLMPEGLEAALTPQQVADVMAFLQAKVGSFDHRLSHAIWRGADAIARCARAFALDIHASICHS